MKNGVPYDIYMKWSRARRTAAVVTLKELEGLRYDWESGQYVVME
ncbi:hypothetical protein AAJCM20276_27100 [Acetobacter aceti]|uniref:Uncharacterized protein n=1 Tax=Acetobacter aceti TaxID=435 RepID=A0A6S6PMV4_ACEAC|nr:hypothetical protein AAJCM20276_27100 [Acetobacter aceti]